MKKTHVSLRPFRFLSLILLCAFFWLTGVPCLVLASSSTVKTVPIPPKRPNVLNASPAYIKTLIDRNNNRPTKDYKSGGFPHVQEMGSQDLLVALIDIEPSVGNVKDIEDFSDNPRPVRMVDIIPPQTKKKKHSPPPLPPASPSSRLLSPAKASLSTESVRPVFIPEAVEEKESEKALVSFTLEPNQLSLDPALKDFLLEHAVEMFKNDPDLRLEIHAYAGRQNDQAYSDVRRSLARALEVRSFLLEQNIDPSRLKLTPLGQDAEEVSDNRIDLLFIASGK